MLTRDELLAKLEAYYKPLVAAQRADEAKAQAQANIILAEWSAKRKAVNDNFDAQVLIVEKTALISTTQPTVDEAAALPAPKALSGNLL